MPVHLSSSCEYMATEDIEECVSDSWLPMGNRIETAPTRAKGIALELMLNLTDGFYDPLRDSSSNEGDPISHLSIDFETQCVDESCQFYVVLANYVSSLKDNKECVSRIMMSFRKPAKKSLMAFNLLAHSAALRSVPNSNMQLSIMLHQDLCLPLCVQDQQLAWIA